MSALLFFAESPKNDGPGHSFAIKIGTLPARGQYRLLSGNTKFSCINFAISILGFSGHVVLFYELFDHGFD